jgi:hypothetical protein
MNTKKMADTEAIKTEVNSSTPSQNTTSTNAKGSPNDFLKKVIGKHVVVRLNSGVDYHGKCFEIIRDS